MARISIGIDLGTTNSAMAFVAEKPRATKRPPLETLSIPQLADANELVSQPLLPSFTYLPAEHEKPALEQVAAQLPWEAANEFIVGVAARALGGRVTGRLVASAKSWLCHEEVDRRAAILPWGADADIPKISPVFATSLYLRHLKEAWNAAHAGDEKKHLEHQDVVLTVPASFDEVARELTVEAAKQAGIERLTLLEEPQAAFYHWMHAAGQEAFQRLPVGSVCVVVDCGGGTTDFSLIAVVEREGVAQFERLAVGDHLLLGGDNMDLALARHVENLLSANRRLDATQWGNLVHSCRRVKESMLGESPPEKMSVAVMGRGRQIIGGSLATEMTGNSVRQIVLDGFFPTVGFGEEPLAADRAGLREFGLPYVADPAVTRHLAAFLRRHSETIREVSHDGGDRPHAVLFNGGVFNAPACRDQILHVLRCWFGSTYQPHVLVNDELDLAVARGAAYFGWLKRTGGLRIKSGAARSYYIGVSATNDRDATEPQSQRTTVVCLVPHGLTEGEQIRLDEPAMELRVGEPVSFPLFSSTTRMHDAAGQILTIEPKQLAAHPPITTVLRGGRRAGTKQIPVRLEARLTEIGTLELFCAAKDGGNRWKLQFQARSPGVVRESSENNDPSVTDSPSGTAAAAIRDTWSQEELSAADALLREVYSPSTTCDPQRAVNLPKLLEEALNLSRGQWPKSLLRTLWDPLHDVANGRKLSVEHEWRWYNLAGFLLRPGWGDPIDPYRVEQLWKVIHQGVIASKSDRALSEFWVMARRTAGGLDANRQTELARRISPLLQLGGKKPARRVGPNELAEGWRAIVSCEHLQLDFKTQLGESLIRMLRKPPIPGFTFWSLTRLGSRTLLYGPANLVVHPATAALWLKTLMQIRPETDNGKKERDFAIAQIARATGDRARDIDDDLRKHVLDSLQSSHAAPRLLQIVREPTPLEIEEESTLLGDRVPPGLIVRAF